MTTFATLPLTALVSSLTNLRMHRSGQPAVNHLVADVLSLQVLPKAARAHYKKKAANPCAA